MDSFKTVIKNIWFWIICIGAILVFAFYIFGFRITYAPNLETSWNAVGAMGQWAGAFVGFLIPIAVIYLQNKIDKNKRDIGEANSALYDEFNNFKVEYLEKIIKLIELIDENGNIVVDGGNFDEMSDNELKEKALKFINISMIANTKRVAEHLKINDDKAYELLVEMARHDDSISCGGQLRKENMYNIVWTKRR